MAEEAVNFFLHSSEDVLNDFERDFEHYSTQYQEIPYVDDYVIKEKLKGMEHLASVVKLVEQVSKLAWKKSELEKKCDCLRGCRIRNNVPSSPYSPEEDHDQNSIWNKGLQKMRAKSTKVKASFNKGKEEKVQKLHQRSQSTGSIDIDDILQRSDSDSRRKRREAKFSKRRLSKWARKVRAGLAPERALSHVVSAKEIVISKSCSKSLKAEITKSRSHSDFNNLENSMSSAEPSPTITVYGEEGRLLRRRSSPSLYVEENSSPLRRSGSLKSAVSALKRVKGALRRTGSFKGDEYIRDNDNKKRTIDHIVLLSPPARRSTYNSNEPVRKQATARTRPTRTSLAAFPSDERGGIQNFLTADLAKRIGEWDNRRNSAQHAVLKHEDSFSQEFIKKMHEWEKKKALVEKEKSPKTLAPPVDTISNHSNTSEERQPLNLGEDFSKKVAEWERIKEQTYLNPAAENGRSRSKERQKYQKMVSKDMQKIERAQLKIEKEKAKLERLKETISVNEEALCHGLSQEFAKKYHNWQKQLVETDSRSISPIPNRRTKLEHAQESVEVEEIAMSIASPDKTLIRTVNSLPKQMTVADSSKPEQYFAGSLFDNEANNLANVLKTDIEKVGKRLISFDKKESKEDLYDLENSLEELSRLLERFDSAPKVSHATTADILKMATKINLLNIKLTKRHIIALKNAHCQLRLLNKCVAFGNYMRRREGAYLWKRNKSDCNLNKYAVSY
ncbi:DgyrCDS7094 [Dimorphilus gyrociliatus]|uniref:DgyrCDS7094 n=1 Tax=Dimorphilus gyrociliatus TaxID=2664684 RepID=A0A7I8VQ00_9ANNE|nr:DgyrCDS7094 [Dimorphilus gyrociliatus]